ncbi:hypothetical protein AO240_15010 [Pseudomonas sp. ICMP 460]|nr:hypothetical protein AO240_15010 [Pseudomonas sp. ICMP 460]
MEYENLFREAQERGTKRRGEGGLTALIAGAWCNGQVLFKLTKNWLGRLKKLLNRRWIVAD